MEQDLRPCSITQSKKIVSLEVTITLGIGLSSAGLLDTQAQRARS
jgi:hypothetical protein